MDARGAQDLHQDLTHEAEADDAGRLAELRFRLAESLHRDGADGGEGGVQRRHLLRNRDAQILRHPVVFRVQRELIARAGDALADLEFLDACAHRDDDARQRVAERRIAVEAVHDLLVGRDRSLLRQRLHDLLDLVGTRARLADERQLALVDLHGFGAHGDQRVIRPYENAARLARRNRHIEKENVARLIVLRDLFHGAMPKVECERQQLTLGGSHKEAGC